MGSTHACGITHEYNECAIVWLIYTGWSEPPRGGERIIAVDNFIWLLELFFVKTNHPFVHRKSPHLRGKLKELLCAPRPFRYGSLRGNKKPHIEMRGL